MKNKTLLLIAFVICSGIIQAADKKRLNQSTPNNGRARVENCASTLENIGNKHKSAPGRLSAEEFRGNDTTEQIPLEEEKLKRKNLSDSPLQRSRFISKSPDSKKLFFISSDMLDDASIMSIKQLRDEIKKVAHDNNLKKSNFYAIIKGIRPEIIQSSAQIMMLANYYIFKIATTESFKDYLDTKPSLIPLPNQNFRLCVHAIRTCLNHVTHNVITWPTIRREENSQQYYQELLEKNSTINVSDVAFSYYGATVAIALISQIKDRSLNMRDRIKPITESETLAKKHRKAIIKSFQSMACFVPNLNITFDPTPLKDETNSSEGEE